MPDKLFGDHPIAHPRDDAFGLSSFANALATSLLQMSPADGLGISVEGPWGSGKSSAIALPTHTIKLRDFEIQSVDFQRAGKLVRAFCGELAAQLRVT